MAMMKAVSSIEWNFDKTSGNAVFVEKPQGDYPSKTRHGEAVDVTDTGPDENSNEIGNNGAPQEKADIDQKVPLLKESGTEKFKNKDYQGALADLDAACDIDPRCVSSLNFRAEIKRILCQYEEALKDLNLANEIQPNNVFTLSTRGAVYKELKEFKNALEDLDRANELDGNDYFIKTQRGIVKIRLRNYEGALEDLSHEANAKNPNQALVMAQIGVVERELGHHAKALEYLNRASEFQPNPYVLRRRGVTRRELLDYQGSLDDLNMANTLEPYNDMTLSERGVTKKALGDFQGALQDLTMANHIKCDQAFALKHRGSVCRELGNLEEALQNLTCANFLEPNDFFTLLELALTKKLDHDFEGALVDVNRLVEMEPNNSSILRQRGILKRMLGDCKGALEDLNTVDELEHNLFGKTLPTIMERCFTKYAMKDVAGALQDAKAVRDLWGVYGISSIMGEKLKQATTKSGECLEHASSMSQRLYEIEKSTSSHRVLWIEHRKLIFLKDLGRGSFGFVQKCRWVEKNKDVAVKYVSSQLKGAFEYEVRMLANIRHPRVVRLIGCSYDDEEKQGLLVMELMQWNLRSLIDGKKQKNGLPFDLPVAVDIMTKIAEAMEYLHEQGVLHRDLKSSNVLVNKIEDGNGEYVVKLADFGTAKLQRRNNMPYFMTVNVGATLWRAPEVFKNDTYQKYSFPADVWSFGITCFEILSGEEPFEGVPCAQLHHKIMGGLRPKLPPSCPSVLKLLLTKCWSLMPYDRPTFSNIHKILKLYLGTVTSRDFCNHKYGDAIRPHELRRHSI